jgi:hypothetical protein
MKVTNNLLDNNITFMKKRDGGSGGGEEGKMVNKIRQLAYAYVVLRFRQGN